MKREHSHEMPGEEWSEKSVPPRAEQCLGSSGEQLGEAKGRVEGALERPEGDEGREVTRGRPPRVRRCRQGKLQPYPRLTAP